MFTHVEVKNEDAESVPHIHVHNVCGLLRKHPHTHTHVYTGYIYVFPLHKEAKCAMRRNFS